MWEKNFPSADFDCLELIEEIVDAYKGETVSAESCMEEISSMIYTRKNKLKERFDKMQDAIDAADEVLKDG